MPTPSSRTSLPSAARRDRAATPHRVGGSPPYVRGGGYVIRADDSHAAGWRQHPERARGGQGIVEHALMLIAIAVMVIILVSALGHPIGDLWSAVSNGLSS